MACEECEGLLSALGAVAACHRHLALTVGGAADSRELREELRETRQKAQELAGVARTKLTAALRDRATGKAERAELERLWAGFSACLELLEGDMRRALRLGRAFPLGTPGERLIRTGLRGTTSGVAAWTPGARNAKREAEAGVDAGDLADLEQEIRRVGETICEMEGKVRVPRWAVEAKRGPGAELSPAVSLGASSLGAASAAESKACRDPPGRLLAGVAFAAVVLVAVALAAFAAQLA